MAPLPPARPYLLAKLHVVRGEKCTPQSLPQPTFASSEFWSPRRVYCYLPATGNQSPHQATVSDVESKIIVDIKNNTKLLFSLLLG